MMTTASMTSWICWKRINWIFVLIVGLTYSLSAQSDTITSKWNYLDPDGNIQVDSTAGLIVRKAQSVMAYYQSDRKLPDPQTAVWMSIILPGTGQMYNKQAWKLPVVYGGFGWALYNLGVSQSLYRRFRTAYELDIAGEEREFPGLNRESLRTYRDQYRRQVELNYLGIGGVYVLGILDAFVSAHLSSFDISEDLTLKIPPPNGFTGFQLAVSFTF